MTNKIDQETEHGKLYWLFHNLISGPKSFAKKHWLLFPILMAGMLLLLFMSRGYTYELVITCRKYFGAVLVGIPTLIISYRIFRKSHLRGKIIATIIFLLAGLFILEFGQPIHDYFSLWWRYTTLNIFKIDRAPETAYERIHPLKSLFTMAGKQIASNNSPTEAHFVRMSENQYCFTIGAEPRAEWSYLSSRLFGGVTEVYVIPGTKPNIDLSSPGSKIKVSFECGENLLFGHNAYTATCRAFGLWRYLNYEPDGLIYMNDDNGQLVQVVPLIRWKGILFPWPEFGGVQVIEQAPNTIFNSCKRALVGVGYYVSPQEIQANKYPFLKGQNICSYKVTRYMAESFKFRKGITAPLPMVHRGDTRIADMEEDYNPLPFVIYNKMSTVVPGASDSLYQFYSLEPYNSNTQGTVAMLYVPADGTPIVYAVDAEENNLNLVGISSVPELARNSHPNFDWTSHAAVEARPFTRTIDGKHYNFSILTVVTKNENNNKTFIGGNNPNIALVNMETRRVFWMQPPESSTWIGQLRDQMKLPVGDPRLPPLPGATDQPVPPPIPVPSVASTPNLDIATE